MLENIIYPPLAHIQDANNDTNCINGIIAMAVFCDDHEKLNYAVRAFKNEPGVDGNGLKGFHVSMLNIILIKPDLYSDA
ncbi:hypothetical protein [Pedobacter rhodius]|uniref:Uncharacterized protein n=1 Tax=Pedobacter rhodius TaxID=3004098 RepID=A0ABT4KWG4_9SPHI|nr:hypothetical protein [Pedobacter sp. SJ11]MCZ4223266.1 hypothetical protein [Pedobacter sp. SJ11]